MKTSLLKIKEFLTGLVDYLVVTSFVVFVCGVFVFFIFDIGVLNATTENRNLKSLPVLPRSFLQLQKYTKEYTAYFDDHVPYRNQITAFYNKSLMNIFKISGSDKVLLGEQGWLYFNGNDGKSFDEYLGKDILTKKQIELLETYLIDVNEMLRAQGRSFVVSIAPKKETIYPEYLPDGYSRGSKTKMDQVVSILKDKKILFTDLRPQLIAGKKEQQLYYKTDTHWNQHGGYIQYSSVMKDLGLLAQPAEYFKIHNLPEQVSGDLASKMLGRDDIRENWETLGFSSAVIVDPDPQADNGFSAENINAPYKKNVFVFGDSFSRVLTSLMAESFREVRFEWAYDVNYDLVKSSNPDFVVLEFAEGKVSALIDSIAKNTETVPSMVIGVRETNNVSWRFDEFVEDDDVLKINGWAHINKKSSEKSLISVVLSSDTTNYLIPTMPIRRTDVTTHFSSLNFDDSGFSINLKKKNLQKGIYSIAVYINKKGIIALQYTDKIVTVN
ncbi:MAG: hypothetical protein UT32_C0004G0011 [Parcubacteria group bacterium GW2011_GWC2_39_14]|nr:MAG: hypothetical protein UT32_C0004G0011 [Parcubacteria group bacterium GW2011_GWC2_39_14]KKR54855.1 MAG: hypothetical protein UT91_C0008G0011 [Parcubacteria group bacterium GW2011_GWA2_40_23]